MAKCDIEGNSKSVESVIFRMEGGAFAAALVRNFGRGWIIAFAVIVIASIIPGIFIDGRFLIIALMVVLIVIPLMLSFLYYSYGLRRECFINTIPHTVSIEEDSVKVKIFTDRESEDENEWKYRELLFPKKDFGKYKVDGDAVEFEMGNPRRGFLWLPLSAYADPCEYMRTIYSIAGTTVDNAGCDYDVKNKTI